MAIGPFKATVVDVFNQRLGVGGINIVKDLGISPNLHLHGESRIKALFVVNNLQETGSPRGKRKFAVKHGLLNWNSTGP